MTFDFTCSGFLLTASDTFCKLQKCYLTGMNKKLSIVSRDDVGQSAIPIRCVITVQMNG